LETHLYKREASSGDNKNIVLKEVRFNEKLGEHYTTAMLLRANFTAMKIHDAVIWVVAW
jgi:hypothetical protein